MPRRKITKLDDNIQTVNLYGWFNDLVIRNHFSLEIDKNNSTIHIVDKSEYIIDKGK